MPAEHFRIGITPSSDRRHWLTLLNTGALEIPDLPRIHHLATPVLLLRRSRIRDRFTSSPLLM